MPRLVGEMSVGRYRVNLYAHALEFSVVVGQVAQLSRAHKGEVSRVEEHHGPFALQVGIGNRDEFALMVGLGAEWFNC